MTDPQLQQIGRRAVLAQQGDPGMPARVQSGFGDPGPSALYHVVRNHFETFRAHAAGVRDGEGLPGFVEREFRDFLRCGWLAGGFARLRCTRRRSERLVAFSSRIGCAIAWRGITTGAAR